HTTALCSPTRAALLTGRNHQSVGMGNITEFATGYPGYTSIMPKSAGTVGNILVDNGYDTAWLGKHHLVPEWMQGPGGPFDQWAGGLGFEYFYGFLGGDTDQYHPALFENTHPVLPPFGDPHYLLIHDLADRTIAARGCSGQALLRVFRSGQQSRSPPGPQRLDRQVQG